MAGFADIEPTHFTPYVPQMPVDDYINAGMMLQQRYNQGVERTQSFIDNVAGMNVAGEANTQYLRGKVSQLESQVSRIAGSDFSKNSVSSQVGNLAGTIERDPVIQAGMTSAVRLQNYDKSWKDLEKDHPDQYAAGNKEYYDQFVNDYLKQSQTKAGLVYNGPTEAVAHNDYYNKLDKQLKELDPSITTTISPAGEFMYKVDKNSTVSRDQIDGIINTTLLADPAAQQQMKIDAWHSYRSFDGMQMFDHVNKSFGSMIDTYKGYTKYYQDQIKSNPNDHDLITANQKKILDFNTEINTLSTNRDTYLKELNQGNLEGVKDAVFNDSIRQGLILKYERNNVTTDLKNNENAIEAYKNRFEQEHIDIEGRKADIEEESYKLKLLEFQKKMANGDFGGQTFSVAGQVGQDYTEDAHNSAITTTQGQLSDWKTKLRSLPGKSDMDDTAWQQYQDVQEAKYQNGDLSVDPDYAQYKSKTQVQAALLNTQLGIAKKINDAADVKYGVDNVLPASASFSGVPDPDSPGRTVTITAGKNVIKKALEIRDTVDARYNEASKGSSDPMNTSGYVPLASTADYVNAASKYKDDPSYKSIVALAQSKQLNDLAEKSGAVRRLRNDFVATSYKDYGKTVSYQATPLAGKPEQMMFYKNLAIGSNNEQGTKVTDKMIPISMYTDEQGRGIIQYKDNPTDTELHTVMVPADKNTFTNPDPYQPIERILDLSPDHTTPHKDATQALSTTNGKLKYVLGKNQLSGNLEMSIWNRGTLYKIPSFTIQSGDVGMPNVGSYIDRIEQISKMNVQQKTQFLAQLSPEDRKKWGDVLGLN